MSEQLTFDTDTVRRRLRDYPAGVRSSAGRVRGDHDLNPDLRPKAPLVPAAVLVPIVARPEGPTVLLTRRTPHLNAHGGQISFPGGRIEPEDVSPEAAALREAEEEVGLDPALVEIAGRLDTYQTRTGFEIFPLVGVVSPRLTLHIDPHEVAEAFEVPLAFLLDAANHQRRQRIDIGGVAREFWAMPYGDYFIWGATAGMLINLHEVMTR